MLHLLVHHLCHLAAVHHALATALPRAVYHFTSGPAGPIVIIPVHGVPLPPPPVH